MRNPGMKRLQKALGSLGAWRSEWPRCARQTTPAPSSPDWDVADETHIKSITGYRKLQWNVELDTDGSPVEMNQGSFAQTQHQISEELQLAGAALSDRLKYSAGLYYFNEEGREADYVTIGQGLLQIQGYEAVDTKSYAAYTHVDYTVIDHLTLIAGGRYSYDDKSLSESQPVFAVTGPPFETTPPGKDSQNFKVFTPTLGLQYEFAKYLMSYFTYSKGYKDGGWTTRLTASLDPLRIPTFGPEQANIQGVELEATWIIGNGFSLAATGAFIDACYTFLAPGINSGQSCVQPFEGCITLNSMLPKTPRWKYSLSPTYKGNLPNGGSVRLGLDFTHTSVIANDAINTSLERYELTVGGTNITDDRFLTTGNQDTASSIIYGTYNPPAELYVTGRVKF